VKAVLARLKLCLWPLRVTRTKLTTAVSYTSSEYIGFMTIFVFGIPVAKIQLTNPWE